MTFTFPTDTNLKAGAVRQNSGGTGFHVPTTVYGTDGVTPISTTNKFPVNDADALAKLAAIQTQLDGIIDVQIAGSTVAIPVDIQYHNLTDPLPIDSIPQKKSIIFEDATGITLDANGSLSLWIPDLINYKSIEFGFATVPGVSFSHEAKLYRQDSSGHTLGGPLQLYTQETTATAVVSVNVQGSKGTLYIYNKGATPVTIFRYLAGVRI